MKPKITNQQLFDTVCQAMMGQGRPSRDEGSGRCSYLRHDGDSELRCAIGHLFKTDPVTNRQARQNRGSATRSDVLDMLQFEPTVTQIDMMLQLQEAHDWSDREDFLGSFTNSACRVAGRFNLDTDILGPLTECS